MIKLHCDACDVVIGRSVGNQPGSQTVVTTTWVGQGCAEERREELCAKCALARVAKLHGVDADPS